VQRPTTPFEALEAARQDAAYQAAHEQAVQVVNGIAAQYVETRSALATISEARGEDFASLLIAPSGGAVTRQSASEPSDANPEVARSAEFNQPRSYYHASDLAKTREQPTSVELNSDHTEYGLRSHAEFRVSPLNTPSRVTLPAELERRSLPQSTEALGPFTPAVGPRQSISEAAAPAVELEPLTNSSSRPTTEVASLLGVQDPNKPSKDSSGSERYERLHESTLTAPTQKPARTRLTDQNLARELEIENVEPPGIESPPTQLSPPRPDHLQVDTPISDRANAAIIPPYSGVGSVRHIGEERNPRPAYLKERKSVWLPSTVAAPADGILSPEWFELP